MDHNKKIKIIIALLFLSIIILSILAYVFREDIYYLTEPYFNKTEYVRNREQPIIAIADTRYLQPYLHEKGTMVVFFSSDCGYCLKEADELNNFIEHNKRKNVVVVFHDTPEDTKAYLEEKGYRWFTIADPNKTIRQHVDPGSSGIPSTYFFGESGTLLNKHNGRLTEKTFELFYQGNNMDVIPNTTENGNTP